MDLEPFAVGPDQEHVAAVRRVQEEPAGAQPFERCDGPGHRLGPRSLDLAEHEVAIGLGAQQRDRDLGLVHDRLERALDRNACLCDRLPGQGYGLDRREMECARAVESRALGRRRELFLSPYVRAHHVARAESKERRIRDEGHRRGSVDRRLRRGCSSARRPERAQRREQRGGTKPRWASSDLFVGGAHRR